MRIMLSIDFFLTGGHVESEHVNFIVFTFVELTSELSWVFTKRCDFTNSWKCSFDAFHHQKNFTSPNQTRNKTFLTKNNTIGIFYLKLSWFFIAHKKPGLFRRKKFPKEHGRGNCSNLGTVNNTEDLCKQRHICWLKILCSWARWRRWGSSISHDFSFKFRMKFYDKRSSRNNVSVLVCYNVVNWNKSNFFPITSYVTNQTIFVIAIKN